MSNSFVNTEIIERGMRSETVSAPKSGFVRGRTIDYPVFPLVQPQDYINCMRSFAGGVNIITSADGAAWAGMTATAVCSLSAHPPKILCCINKKGVTLNVVRNTENFCINVLSKKQSHLAERFAGMGDIGEEDRFADGDWEPLKSGAPALVDAVSSIDCILDAEIEEETHSIIIGRVVAIRMAKEKEPLIWLDGEFATTRPISDA